MKAKLGLHPDKVMLLICGDRKVVLQFELLVPNTTITAHLYCQRQDRLADQILQKCSNHGFICFLHDNANPSIANTTRQKLLELDWKMLIHQPYSSNCARSKYSLSLL